MPSFFTVYINNHIYPYQLFKLEECSNFTGARWDNIYAIQTQYAPTVRNKMPMRPLIRLHICMSFHKAIAVKIVKETSAFN